MEYSKLKIIAGILGIGFDELLRREARRRRQQRLQLAGLISAVVAVIGGVWWSGQVESEKQRQIALAQSLINQSRELLDREDGDLNQRGLLLNIQALIRLDRQHLEWDQSSEATQARLAADQNLRRALSLVYAPGPALSAAPPPKTYDDNGWKSWTAEATAFSADGTTITAASGWGTDPNAAIVRWRVDSGSEQQRVRIGEPFLWPDLSDRLNPRYFSLGPDGEYLATIADRSWVSETSTASVYQISDTQEVARIEYQGVLKGVALGPRGEYLAIASQTIKQQPMPLQIWHLPDGRRLSGRSPATLPMTPKVLAFSRDGQYLATAGDYISLWKLPESQGTPLIEASPLQDSLYRGEALGFSPDGRYFAAVGTEATGIAGGEPTGFGARLVRVWDIEQSRAIATMHAPETVRGLALSEGGKFLGVIDSENSLMLHALTNGRMLRVFFSPPDRSRLLNLTTQGPGSYGRLTAVAFAPTDDVMAMAGEIDAALWRVSSFDEQAILRLEGKVEAMAFDRDERHLITISRTKETRTVSVSMWDVQTGRELPEQRTEHIADAFKLTTMGAVIVAADDARGSGRGGSANIVHDGKVQRFRYEGDVEQILESQDGKYVAIASALGSSAAAPVSPGRHLVAVFDQHSSKRVLRFEYETQERDNSSPQAFFILDDRWYLSVDDGETQGGGGRRSRFVLWEMKSGKVSDQRTSEMSRLWSKSRAFSQDGQWAATEDDDEVRVFTAAHEREVARISIAIADRNPSRLRSRNVALGSKGRYVAAITGESTVRIWPVDISLMIPLACSRLTRELSSEEWAHYLPAEKPESTCGREAR